MKKRTTPEASPSKASNRVGVFSDEQIQEIALSRYRGIEKTGKRVPIEELVNEFKNRKDKDFTGCRIDRFSVSDAISLAFMKGLVALVPSTKLTEPDLDSELQRKLLIKYSKLDDAVVIKSSTTQSDEQVHRNLGMAMAKFLTTRSIIQTGDVFGIGSGRGVEMTVLSLQHYDRLRAQHVKVVSLTGNVYSAPNVRANKLWYDADRHVIEFARRFENEPEQYLIGQPLAYGTADELGNAQERVWIGRPDPQNKHPNAGKKRSIRVLNHIFVGVGTFADEYRALQPQPAHRFYTEATAKPEEQEPFLKPIHEDLQSLKTACDEAIRAVRQRSQNRFPYYTPAAEMSNFFFFVPPPKGIPIPNEREITDQINAINSKLLNMREEHIRKAKMLVIAGTAKKAHSLKALLDANEKAYPVRYACLDSVVCKNILSGDA